MKNITKHLVLAATTALTLGLNAQNPTCTGGRYVDPIFATYTETTNIEFGSNTNQQGLEQVLTMDIFQPDGDTQAQRPLIILVHGGTFISGTKDDPDVTELCQRFAKLGYVTASINYRLGFGLPPNEVTVGQALIRAVHDLKAAIRFFRKDAATTNTYKIDPSAIIVGGSSAGALTALHVAFLDNVAEVPNFLDVNAIGGIEGTSGNPGYPTNVRAVVNLCGALVDTAWIRTGDIPVVSVHGTDDAVVPYGTQTAVVFGFPILDVSGSRDLHVKLDQLGIPNSLKTFNGQGHVPYVGNGDYMDTTFTVTRDFLANIICNNITSVPATQVNATQFDVTQNPAQGSININVANAQSGTLSVIDLNGRTLLTQPLVANQNNYAFATQNLSAGVYMVKLTNNGRIGTLRIIVNQ